MAALRALAMPESCLLLNEGKIVVPQGYQGGSDAKSRSTSAGSSPRPPSSSAGAADPRSAGASPASLCAEPGSATCVSPRYIGDWAGRSDPAIEGLSFSQTFEALFAASLPPLPPLSTSLPSIPPPPGLEDAWATSSSSASLPLLPPPGLAEEEAPATSAYLGLSSMPHGGCGPCGATACPPGIGGPPLFEAASGFLMAGFEGDALNMLTTFPIPHSFPPLVPPPPALPPSFAPGLAMGAPPPPPPPPRFAPPPVAAPSEVGLMTVARNLLNGPPAAPALGSAELPTVGSATHGMGNCKPCAFVHTKGCGNGVACQFCHLCSVGEKKRRKQERRCVAPGRALRLA